MLSNIIIPQHYVDGVKYSINNTYLHELNREKKITQQYLEHIEEKLDNKNYTNYIQKYNKQWLHDQLKKFYQNKNIFNFNNIYHRSLNYIQYNIKSYEILKNNNQTLNNNMKYKGIMIYNNCFNNYKIINHIFEYNPIIKVIIISNMKKWNKYNYIVYSYKLFYKKIKECSDIFKKYIIILDNPSPTNKILRNLKCKFIIILTKNIDNKLFRIILPGFINCKTIHEKISNNILSKMYINNKISKKIILIKMNPYQKLFKNMDSKTNNKIILSNFDKKFYSDNCPVCFDKNSKTYFKCGHNFCINCITNIINFKNNCPLCRFKICTNNGIEIMIDKNNSVCNKEKKIKNFIKNYKKSNIIFYTKYKITKILWNKTYPDNEVIFNFKNINLKSFNFNKTNIIIMDKMIDCDCLINYIKEFSKNFNNKKIKLVYFLFK